MEFSNFLEEEVPVETLNKPAHPTQKPPGELPHDLISKPTAPGEVTPDTATLTKGGRKEQRSSLLLTSYDCCRLSPHVIFVCVFTIVYFPFHINSRPEIKKIDSFSSRDSNMLSKRVSDLRHIHTKCMRIH